MKILAINRWANADIKKRSPIDFWRIHSPLEELKQHVDWQIDYQPVFLPGTDEFTSPDQFDEAALERAAKELGQYDVIFSSYQPSPFVFALLNIVRRRYGTKYVLDDDDDVFNIEPDSFFWRNNGEQDARSMQRQIELAEFITTTTPTLQRQFEHFTEKAKVFVLPNSISNAYHNDRPKDGDRINIGYFGGASHYYDLHETGILPALEKLMHQYKQVHFTTIGIPTDYYLPKARYHELESGDMDTWLNAVYPSLNFDIVIAPLRRTLFSESKSNIKWQEATRMGAAFVASDVGPYRDLKPATASLTNNTPEDWYDKLEALIAPEKRAEQVLAAQAELHEHWLMENNWTKWRDMFDYVAGTVPDSLKD